MIIVLIPNRLYKQICLCPFSAQLKILSDNFQVCIVFVLAVKLRAKGKRLAFIIATQLIKGKTQNLDEHAKHSQRMNTGNQCRCCCYDQTVYCQILKAKGHGMVTVNENASRIRVLLFLVGRGESKE